jgi:hypothetical protein
MEQERDLNRADKAKRNQPPKPGFSEPGQSQADGERQRYGQLKREHARDEHIPPDGLIQRIISRVKALTR